MKWSEFAIQDLKKFGSLGESIGNIEERLEALEMKFTSVRGQQYDDMPKAKGRYKADDAIVDNIVERERLKLLLEANKRLYTITEKGLNALDENERMILEKFYVKRCDNHLRRLMEALNVEQSQIYRMKDNALYKFTQSMYGMEEY